MATSTPSLETGAPPAGRARAERVARGILLIIMFSVAAIVAMRQPAWADNDIWWHLRAGQWILQHRAVPYADPFSRLGPGHPWQAYSWIFELIVLRLFTAFGLVGLAAYSTGMALATAAALYGLVSRLQRDFTFSVLLVTGAFFCMWRLDTPRPWHFTILFFILQLNLLEKTRRDGRWRRLLWLLPMYAAWANIHIQFIDGLVVLGATVAEPIVMRWWPWPEPVKVGAGKLLAIMLACMAATLVNPYGWHIYQVAYALASQPGVLDKIGELSALAFRAWNDYLILAIPIAVFGVCAWKRRFPCWQTLLMAMAVYLSFRSRRDVWFVVSVGAMILAAELPLRNEEEAGSRSADQRGSRPHWAAVPLIALGTLGCIAGSAAALHINNPALKKQFQDDMPVSAVEAIRLKGYPGPLFNNYDWGGFLMWELRMPVTIDGRASFYGDQRLDRSIQTWNGEPGWDTDPELQTARLVVAPAKSPLTQLLKLDSHFTITYQDKQATVFVRK